jgi:pilus assembly protein CpaE
MGAAQVLPPSELEDEFVPLLRKLSGPKGALIPVLSAGGASGGTTLAINLAREVVEQHGRTVLLVDMDAHYGAVASYLGLTGRYGIADVLAHGEHVDGTFLSTAVVPVEQERIHVLLSPFTVRPTAPAPLQLQHLSSALEVCRTNYAYTVVDAPRLGVTANAALAEVASSGLIVLQQMVKDVHVARAVFQALTEAGLPADRLRYVVNRYSKKNPFISLAELRDALGTEQLAYLSNDFSAIVEAVNLGRMLADIKPKSTLRNEIRALAKQLAAEGAAMSA